MERSGAAVNPTLEIPITHQNVARLDLAVSEALRSLGHASTLDEQHAREVRFTGTSGQDFLGAGLSDLQAVWFSGSAGKFAFCGMDNCECTLEEDAGDSFGHSLASGVLICKGSVGDGVGAMARAGLIAVYGSAGDRAGASLRGADLLIRGNAGKSAGVGMRQGTLIIGGSAGEQLGVGMKGGVIFLRGDASSISPDIEEHRLREPDRLKLGLLLLKAGIKATAGKEFRVFRPSAGSS
jgi:formylmethanofuran dehydrogenase subunit C